MGKCFDRDDINITYEWDKTTYRVDLVTSEPFYSITAGDTVILTLNSDALTNANQITNISIVSDKNGTLSMIPGNDSYSFKTTIPMIWNNEDIFKVILTYGGTKYLLWQGLVNSSTPMTGNVVTIDIDGDFSTYLDDNMNISNEDLADKLRAYPVGTMFVFNYDENVKSNTYGWVSAWINDMYDDSCVTSQTFVKGAQLYYGTSIYMSIPICSNIWKDNTNKMILMFFVDYNENDFKKEINQ